MSHTHHTIVHYSLARLAGIVPYRMSWFYIPKHFSAYPQEKTHADRLNVAIRRKGTQFVVARRKMDKAKDWQHRP